MYYGDNQANYTDARAAYGGFGGALYEGGMGGGGYGGGGYDDSGNPVSGIGGAIRPVGYTPPARVYMTPSGMYQQRTGMGVSFGNAIGWNDTPRNVSTYDFRTTAAGDFSERMGSGLAAGGLTTAAFMGGLALTGAGSAAGAAAGGIVGSGIGGFLGFGAGSALAGGSIFGSAGAAIGGFAGAILPGIALGAAASKVTDLMASQREVRGYLESSSFRSVGAASNMADSRTASGMGYEARRGVADLLTQMDVKDPMMNMHDLQRVLQGSNEMGLLNNASGMEDFKKKFKEITENVKVVARTLNTTLEEGLKTMKEIKSAGMDVGMAGQITTQADTLGKVAGRTASEMMSLGFQGAELYRGTGVSMSIGFQASQMNMSSIRASRDAGLLSNEAVAQSGGEEALAMRMTAGGLSYQQTALGRGSMASFYNGGKLDQAAFAQNLLSGGNKFTDIAQSAAQNLASPGALISFEANQEKMLSDSGKRFGGMAPQFQQMAMIMSQAEHLSNQTGNSMEDSFRYTARSMGRSAPEIDTMLAGMKNADGDFNAKQKSASTVRDREQIEQGYNNNVFTRFSERFISDPLTKVADFIASPVNKHIDDFREGFTSWSEKANGGFERVDVSKINIKDGFLEASLRTGGKFGSGPKGKVDLDAAGIVGESAGERLASRRDSIAENFGGKFTQGEDSDINLDSKFFSKMLGRNVGMNQDEFKRLSEESSIFKMTDIDAARIKTRDGYGKAKDTVSKSIVGKDLSKFTSATDLVREITGKKSMKDVSQEEMAAILEATSGTSVGKLLTEARTDANALQSAGEAMGAKELIGSSEEFAKFKKRAFEGYNVELDAGSLEEIVQASQMHGSDRETKLAGVISRTAKSDPGGRSIEKIRNKILGLAGDKELIGDAEKVLNLTRGTQVARGVAAKKEQLETIAKRGDLDGATSDSVLAIAGKITGDASSLLALSDAEMNTLKKADVGLAGFAGDLKSLQGTMGKDGKLDKAAFDKVLKESGSFHNIDEKSRIALAESAGSGDLKKASTALYQSFFKDQASQTATTAGGDVRDTNMATGTAQDQFSVQTAINQEQLVILRALAAKLGAK